MVIKKTDSPILIPEKKLRKIANNTTRIKSLFRGLFLILTASMLTLFFCESVSGQEKSQMVRLAKLQINSTQLVSYKVALKEEIESSLRLEPGVLTLYAVAEKDRPTHITVKR